MADVDGFRDDSEVLAYFEGVTFDLADLDSFAEDCEEYGEAFELRYFDLGGIDRRDFEDQYQGCFDSTECFARDLVDNCYEVPEHLKFYINYESWARDLMMDYSAYEGDAGVHIFRD